jgi:predicted metal-dependent hydrolase
VSLRIDPRAGGVVVTLPLRTGQKAGLDLLRAHAGWVADRLAALPPRLVIEDGALLPVHGRPMLVRHCPDARGGAWIEEDRIHVAGRIEHLPRRVRDFLRAEAGRVLTRIAHDKAAEAGLRIPRIAIKDTRSRWGSCAADGLVMFSWRLIMAPGFVQDYVAAHEVAHLRHMNHGPRFWALVATLTEHQADAIIWLRREGPSLLRIA